MPHIPPPRSHLLRFGAAIATDLMILGLLATQHHLTAEVLTVFAAFQLAWIAVLAARRERTLQAVVAEANTDPVTGLPTRRLLYRHLATRSAETQVTVAYVDVNGLKAVNDAFGHQVGDGLLAVVAQRLRVACAPGDVLVHLGGDEYAIATERDQYQLACSLARVNGDTMIGDVAVAVQVSIGTCRVHGGDPQLALGSADAAMYTAKRRRSGIEHYDPTRDGPPRLLRPRLHQPHAGRHRVGLD
jgi:diguanylate cyclase (GGDEF)-like protein